MTLTKSDQKYIKDVVLDAMTELADIMTAGFDRIDSRFEAVEKRLDKIEARLDIIEKDTRDIKVDLTDTRLLTNSTEARLVRLERNYTEETGIILDKEVDIEKRVVRLEKALNIK